MSERYLRPLEVDVLIANVHKASSKLDWEPQIRFHDLVQIMVDADVESVGLVPVEGGRRFLKRRSGIGIAGAIP